MALIKCPECGHTVSDKAPSCPNCGYPLTSVNEIEHLVIEHDEVELTTDFLETSPTETMEESIVAYQDKTKINTPFYQKTWFAVLMLFIFFPVGVFLIWKYRKFRIAVRCIASVAFCIWFLFWWLVIVALALPCEHEWESATCTEPMVCQICGETTGTALDHSWKRATCLEPKTCKLCGITSGEISDHTWNEATCTQAKTCIDCGVSEGKALGHKKEAKSEWRIDYVNAAKVQEILCERCNEVLDAKKTMLTYFLGNDCFTIYPAAFAERFNNAASSFKCQEEYDETISYYSQSNTLFYEIYDGSRYVGIYSFLTSPDEYVPVSQKNYENSAQGVFFIIDKTSDVAQVVNSAIMAISPNLSSTEVSNLANDIFDNYISGNPVIKSGICYRLLKEGNRYFFKVSPTKVSITTITSDVSVKMGTTRTVYVTVSTDLEDYSIWYETNDSSIVSCEWGEWDGDTLPLKITPLKKGSTSIKLYLEGYEGKSITIKVTVT